MGILFQLAYSHDTRYGVAYPGIENLRARCGSGRSNLLKHLDELERATPPALVRLSPRGGRGRTNRYRLPWHDRNKGYELARKPIPEEPYVIRWESTAKRKRREELNVEKGSEDSDGFNGVKGPNSDLKQSEHSSRTVRTFTPEKSRNYKNSSPSKIERSNKGLTAVRELITQLREIDPKGSS